MRFSKFIGVFAIVLANVPIAYAKKTKIAVATPIEDDDSGDTEDSEDSAEETLKGIREIRPSRVASINGWITDIVIKESVEDGYIELSSVGKRVNAYTCTDIYYGLDQRVLDLVNLQHLLKELKYVPCKRPEPEYRYKQYYKLLDMRFDATRGKNAKQELDCEFIRIGSDESFFVGRKSPTTDYTASRVMDRGLGGTFKARLTPSNPDIAAQEKECLSLLDNFIIIQNQLANRLSKQTGTDYSHLLMPSVFQKVVKETRSMGVGYIILKIAGVILLLGLAWYGFRRMTRNKKPKSVILDDSESGKRKRRGSRRGDRSDEGGFVSDRTEAQVLVGRPLPI